MSKSKQIGTASETGVRNALLRAGFSVMEVNRNVLKGAADEGDVWLRHPQYGLIIFEVKGGKAAEDASEGQVQKWLAETEKEMYNAGAKFGFLVRKKRRVSPLKAEGYETYVDLVDLLTMTGWEPDTHSFPWRKNPCLKLSFHDLIGLLGAPERGTIRPGDSLPADRGEPEAAGDSPEHLPLPAA